MWDYCLIRRPSSTFVPFQCYPISPTRRDQQHRRKITGNRWPSLHSRTDRSRSGERLKTRWITSLPFKGGKALAWDATCSDSHTASNPYSAILNHGSASIAAEDLKRRKFYQHVADTELVPVAAKTTGIKRSAE